jgi:hypothetical protein
MGKLTWVVSTLVVKFGHPYGFFDGSFGRNQGVSGTICLFLLKEFGWISFRWDIVKGISKLAKIKATIMWMILALEHGVENFIVP